MWNKPTRKQLEAIPELYETESIPLNDKKIYMHFFIGSCDWYIAEIDHSNYDTMFGYANLGDSEMAEWGYISLSELENIKIRMIEVDRETNWKPIEFKEIRK